MTKQSPCGICCKIVGHRANAISCSLCSARLHISCVGLTVDQFRIIQGIKSEFLKTVCKQCQANLVQNKTDTSNKRINTTKCSRMPSLPCASPQSVKQPTPSTSSHPSRKQGTKVPSDSPSRPTICSADSKVPMCDKQIEDNDWRVQTSKKPRPISNDLRRRSLMIFYAPESGDSNPQVRYAHDVEYLQSLIDKLLDVNEDGLKVQQIARLGKRMEGKSRPMRVTFAEEASTKLLLSRLNRLKGLKIHVRADLEPADREKLKSAMIELKRRTEDGETNLRIVNFRVVARVPPRIRINRLLILQARPAAPTAVCA
ncbi:unnamed protein product [Dicrocoelium dendriticum]|nr:unnamed protein product [Dicrocoelium dendriticum]